MPSSTLSAGSTDKPNGIPMTKTQLHLNNFLTLAQEAGSLPKLAKLCGYRTPVALYKLKQRLEKQAEDPDARGIRPSLMAKLEKTHRQTQRLARQKTPRTHCPRNRRRKHRNCRNPNCRNRICCRLPQRYRQPQYLRNPNHRLHQPRRQRQKQAGYRRSLPRTHDRPNRPPRHD